VRDDAIIAFLLFCLEIYQAERQVMVFSPFTRGL
jgi:hypothetical protein